MQYLFSGPKISVLKTSLNASKMIFSIYFDFKKCDYDELDTLADLGGFSQYEGGRGIRRKFS